MKVQNTLFGVEFKQRASDGKWVKWGQVIDSDNIYTYTSESGKRVSLVPTKWIILNVYDYEVEFVD